MKLRPVDVVVIALSIGVGGGLIATAFVPLLTNAPISDARAQNIATVIGAIITLIAGYVTANSREKGEDENENENEEEDDDGRKR